MTYKANLSFIIELIAILLALFVSITAHLRHTGLYFYRLFFTPPPLSAKITVLSTESQQATIQWLFSQKPYFTRDFRIHKGIYYD